ncbi:YraN family protein [Aquidulcibacter sp.]|uniref:YraN family protein n=1 Tax=Aquidulcibacter sp. TaxID=2052990 RepID=UPI0025C4C4A8|nr:YraN family protein [Aquidulcibacter sp.]MCA3697981.1 YraN family protein [Aquidulcibacter sp.]
MNLTQRALAERSGRWAENWAAFVLQLKGYAILGRRVQTPAGEIDLIARRGDVLAFIEVKMRQGAVDPAEVLRTRQMSRIVRAATGWTSRRAWTQHFAWRYDLMVVTKWRWPKHVRDAWRPELDPMLSGRGHSDNVISFRARRK